MVLLVAVVTVGAASSMFAGSSGAAPPELTDNGAFGVSAQISLFGGVQPADGPTPVVTLPAGGSSTPVTASAPSAIVKHGPANFFTSDKLDVSTQGTTGASGSVTSSAKVVNVNKSAAQQQATGSEILTADAIESTCTASASGLTGSAKFTNATLQTDSGLDGNPSHPRVEVPVPANPPPSPPSARQTPTPPPPTPGLPNPGHIEVNGSQDFFHIVFNEQVKNPDGSLTVNAVHQYLDGPTAIGDLIIGQVRCSTSAASTATPSASPGSPAASSPSSAAATPGGSSAASPSAAAMAKTGLDTWTFALTGFALVTAGAIIVVLARRRVVHNEHVPSRRL